jgi:hypothetical protein
MFPVCSPLHLVLSTACPPTIHRSGTPEDRLARSFVNLSVPHRHRRDCRTPPPLTPPHKGEGTPAPSSGAKSPASTPTVNAQGSTLYGAAAKSPSPLWGGVRGGGTQPYAIALTVMAPHLASASELWSWGAESAPVAGANSVSRLLFRTTTHGQDQRQRNPSRQRHRA